VTTEGRGSWGYVLAEMWQMGELDKNFMLMHTSSGMLENIMGDYKKCETLIFLLILRQMKVFTRCMAELLGGCGSIRSWDGVWPKLRIWFSIA